MKDPALFDPGELGPIRVRRGRHKPYGEVWSPIIRDTSLSVGARFLYTLLCTYADSYGVAFPAAATLEELAGVERRTRFKWQRELTAAGVLTIEPQFGDNGRQTTNLYVIHDGPQTPDEGGTDDAPPKGVHEMPPRAGTQNAWGGDTQNAPPRGVHGVHPLNTHIEQTGVTLTEDRPPAAPGFVQDLLAEYRAKRTAGAWPQ